MDKGANSVRQTARANNTSLQQSSVYHIHFFKLASTGAIIGRGKRRIQKPNKENSKEAMLYDILLKSS
jgi:hypothetical protein